MYRRFLHIARPEIMLTSSGPHRHDPGLPVLVPEDHDAVIFHHFSMPRSPSGDFRLCHRGSTGSAEILSHERRNIG